MAELRVLLTAPEDGSFAGHLAVASFRRRIVIEGSSDDEAEPLFVPSESSTSIDPSGVGVLEMPDAEEVEGDIELEIVAPDGELLHEESVSTDAIDGEPVEIEVAPKPSFDLEHIDDPTFGRPDRLRGLVVDPTGENRGAHRQVIVRARRATPEDAPVEVVAVTTSDARGYFSAPYPVGSFASASGSVSVGSRTPVPIRLTEEGEFPARVALGIEPSDLDDAGEADEDECACTSPVPRDPDAVDLVESPSTYTDDLGGGHCVDLTKPNRVLEEFDFHTIVRTTEPQIRGLTLAEPPKIDVGTILDIVRPRLFDLAFETKTIARSLALESDPAGGARRAATEAAGAATGRLLAAPRGRPTGLDEAKVLALHENLAELSHVGESLSLAVLREEAARDGDDDGDDDLPDLPAVALEAEITKTLAVDPDGFSLTRLATAEIATRKNDLLRVLDILRRRVPGRGTLTCRNSVDWDDTPTFYQACTIAHGHMLHFKQQWVADGYSLGDLLYSLPLAPCQKKQLAIIDWERRETAVRRESLEEREALAASLSRDRDISEIARASLRESIRGGSEADTSAFGGGLGVGVILGPVGGLLGIGGGTSSASSTAWQRSSRDTSASSLQQLRDRVQQSATAVRSQRSTVIQTVRQGETVSAQSEVVANHNHCHAITIEYFEVLRHFLVRHALADVQECLLVPLLITRFDSAKARRWREALLPFVRDPVLRRGFGALQRIADNYVGSDMPTGSYAEEELEYVDGYMRFIFRIQRPRDDTDGGFISASWTPLAWLGISPLEFWESYLEGQEQRDRIFAELLGPRIAEEIVNGLRFFAVDENDNEIQLPIDPTLVTDFANDRALYVSLRLDDDLPTIRRDQIKFIKIGTIVDTNAGPRDIDSILPDGSKIIVDSGQMRYRTAHLSHDLFRHSRIRNDLSGTDPVLIYTPLSRQELRRPREEDKEAANALLKHLNDRIELFHRVIWTSMDAQRRFMLLDGFIAPNSGGRSVASVVENRLIGIVGNCLVMPVARGFHLDPTFNQDDEDPIDLLEHYQPTTPVAPLRLAVPTKGVFAESIMGSCNACEKKDESRFWRWEESPCPDEPTPIQPLSTESRRAEPPDLTAKDFPAPIVAFQNVPGAPDPQGFGALLQLLGNPNLFRDITGLTENQRNALAALQGALGTAQFFGGKAADLALQGNMRQDIDKALDKINQQHEAGAITDEQRQQLTEAALRSMIGGGTSKPAEPMTRKDVEELTKAAGAEDASVNVTRPGGESVSVDAQPKTASLTQPLQTVCGFFGPNAVVTETDFREGVRLTTEAERRNWIGPSGALLMEDEDQQFGLLVGYWLARSGGILPTTLSSLQANAVSATVSYGDLLDDTASAAQVNAAVLAARNALLVGAVDTGTPANLNALIDQALRSARRSRRDHATLGPWSAVFIVACVRAAMTQLGLEAVAGGNHVGRDEYLLATSAHREYVVRAYRNRFGPNARNGTYHAFRPSERSPRVGDIIVQDRQTNDIDGVIEFDDIPTTLTGGYALHADIVVDVPDAGDFVITVGGNVSDSVRRRRFPLDANDRLVVAEQQLYTQEDDAGNLPGLPSTSAAATLHDRSTGRIFAILSPVQVCAAVPGQPVSGGILV